VCTRRSDTGDLIPCNGITKGGKAATLKAEEKGGVGMGVEKNPKRPLVVGQEGDLSTKLG